MPRKGKRRTIGTGCYQDSSGIEVRVTVGGVSYTKRMPLDSTSAELKKARAQLLAQGHTESPRIPRGTLAADVPRYLKMISHLESWKDRQTHLNSWIALYGDVLRHRLTTQDILTARAAWRVDKKAPKTINHRVDTLRNLYRTLDGARAWSPCDDVTPLPVPKTPIQRIPDDLILKVDRALQEHEADPRYSHLKSGKTRARFRVFVSTGKRPCEIMRAQPSDVNLEARVWVPRDAKGGFCPGIYLNDDMRAAWELFIATKAWGPYSTSAFTRTIRQAGWPAGIRPYHARHTTWITASERGVDLEDIAIGAGHTDPRTTRKAYVPVLNSRLQRLGEALEGRFRGFPVVPVSVPNRNRQRKKAL